MGNNKIIGAKIKNIRESKQLSIEEVAERSGLGIEQMDYHSLSQDKSGRHMEPFLIEIAPSEEGEDFILSTHEGEEFIYVLNGVVEINYGKNTYILEEGDSIYYDSIVAHHVHAAADNRARILGVVYTPY